MKLPRLYQLLMVTLEMQHRPTTPLPLFYPLPVFPVTTPLCRGITLGFTQGFLRALSTVILTNVSTARLLERAKAGRWI